MSRVNIPAADEILDLYFPMLDGGGFIALKDYMGSDQAVVLAARNSYSKGTKKVSDDRGLIRRLMRDKHTSPLEFAELTFHVRAPLYVIQQWLRHRSSSFCSESHRFSVIKDDFQITDKNAWRLQDQDNKQGSSGFLTEHCVEQGDMGGYLLSNAESIFHDHARNLYNKRIEKGIAREQARKDVPHSTYLSIYIKSDLHNLLHFLKLRTAPDAQEEIRSYANIISSIVKRAFPLLHEGWIDYAYAAKSFSRLDILFLNWLQYTITPPYDSENASFKYMKESYENYSQYHLEIGMGKRELAEFWTKLEVQPIPDFELDLSKAKTIEQIEKV